ncbi:solute carrier family 15 member 2 isoform X9 [Athalia rosae]|uniref:solute carrier family 15 member 2 isoform X9 n=1 Tax=Athalia rosae TaxID=37344 RepID=UPI0020340769|nr:solute carrier family 15 member 2 isoform X9 [Athalia rosae]
MYQNLSEKIPAAPDTSKYPRSIFLIIATEFCERFSFCGLRTILSLYLRNVLLFHENEATVIYHVFIMLCYFVPVAGAILADSYLGRFRTILYFSVIYAIGNILMCFAATPPLAISPVTMTYIGLTLIAWGTGGIKPCVAAFGGDQFHLPYQHQRLQQFFSIFYFTINFGGFMGMVLTPILRKAFTCFGDDTCYAMGFGFPAALMVTALFLFLLGKPLYRLKSPKENIMLNFISCILYAAKKRFTIWREYQQGREAAHWLDYASEKFSAKLLGDVKIVLAILFLYIPLPFFWSLFDQQVNMNECKILVRFQLYKKFYFQLSKGSRWTFQASRMNSEFLGTQMLPDQMQESYPVLPDREEATLNFINTLQCDIGFLASFDSDITLAAGERKLFNVTARNITTYHAYLVAPPQCWDVQLKNPTLTILISAKEYQVDTIIVGLLRDNLKAFVAEPDEFKKSLSGRPKVSRVMFLRDTKSFDNVKISLMTNSDSKNAFIVPNKDPFSVSAYMEFEPGFFQYSVYKGDSDLEVDHKASIYLELGAVYTLILREYLGNIVFHKPFIMTPANKIHMFWLIPQYLFISIAEVMFAISGLEFSFTQAPNSMKTVTIAAWYVSVAIGNLLVIIITQARLFKSQAYEFFLFACLILVNMVAFSTMVRKYSFVLLEPDSSVIMEMTTLQNYSKKLQGNDRNSSTLLTPLFNEK